MPDIENETLGQYKSRFAATITNEAGKARIDIGPVRVAMEALGLNDIDIHEYGDIGAYKDRSWATATRFQEQNNWCSVYDKVLLNMGIIGSYRTYQPEVEAIGPDEAREYAEGSVFFFLRGTRWIVGMRDNHQDYGFRRLFGTHERASSRCAQLMWDASTGPLRYPLTRQLLRDSPVGAVIEYEGEVYEKTGYSEWRQQATGESCADGFFNYLSDTVLTRFGEGETPRSTLSSISTSTLTNNTITAMNNVQIRYDLGVIQRAAEQMREALRLNP